MANNTENFFRVIEPNHTKFMGYNVNYMKIDDFICVEPNCREILTPNAHYHCSECPFVFSTKERAQNYFYHPHSTTALRVKG